MVTIDLVETFNWLLGLTIQRESVDCGFHTVEGADPTGKRVLVVWRNPRDERHSNERLEVFFREQGYNDRSVDAAIDRVYVNGDCTLSSIRPDDAVWQVLLTEAEFHRLLFASTDAVGL